MGLMKALAAIAGQRAWEYRCRCGRVLVRGDKQRGHYCADCRAIAKPTGRRVELEPIGWREAS